MPGIKVTVRPSMKGPALVDLPDGVAKVVKAQIRATKEALGDELVEQVQHQLDRVLQHPTGHYRGQIDWSILQGSGALVIYDRGVVYGPWLEGTGSRNATSRFKGYRTFRKITQQAQSDVARVASDHVDTIVKELR